jgi:hypothetical protein
MTGTPTPATAQGSGAAHLQARTPGRGLWEKHRSLARSFSHPAKSLPPLLPPHPLPAARLAAPPARQPLLAFLREQPYGTGREAWLSGVQRPLEGRQPWGRRQLMALLRRVMIRRGPRPARVRGGAGREAGRGAPHACARLRRTAGRTQGGRV